MTEKSWNFHTVDKRQLYCTSVPQCGKTRSSFSPKNYFVKLKLSSNFFSKAFTEALETEQFM